MTMMSNNNNNIVGQFGDTTLTKVFVGGLAWETQKEVMREHFEKYGEILEAVIISDKVTGRSKGYGFVTFKEPEAAKKACEDATPVINGRRANCNLASLGARRPRSNSTSSTTTTTPPPPPPPLPQGTNVVGPRSNSPANRVQWFYPTGTPASPYQHHHHAIPYHPYGYSPTYIAADMSYNPKVGYTGGSYMNGHFSQVYPAAAAGGGGGHGMVNANTMMPVYPFYHYHHQSQTMGVPTHIFPQTTAGPLTSVPAVISKPPTMAPNTGKKHSLKTLLHQMQPSRLQPDPSHMGN